MTRSPGVAGSIAGSPDAPGFSYMASGTDGSGAMSSLYDSMILYMSLSTGTCVRKIGCPQLTPDVRDAAPCPREPCSSAIARSQGPHGRRPLATGSSEAPDQPSSS